MPEKSISLIVGDNPFHGISHLSQERARKRSEAPTQKNFEHAANLVSLCIENGANGFMFSVDETTLNILKTLRQSTNITNIDLFAIVPYAYEYVRKATQTGGVSRLARKLAKEMIFSTNAKVIALNAFGLLRFNPSALLKTYVSYEISRIKSTVKGSASLKSVILHEIITDMALALKMDDLFRSYIKFMENLDIRPGFETRNFAYLVNKFGEWNMDFSKITLVSSFNRIGFQMVPSKLECEEALEHAQEAEIIAMSVFAAGYLKPIDAVNYLTNFKKIDGIVVGVSKEVHAKETFQLLSKVFKRNNKSRVPASSTALCQGSNVGGGK